MNRIVEVLPDVSGLDRSFAYEVPEALAGTVTLGCMVRVLLHGRRVRGWVVDEAEAPPPGIELRPLIGLVSLGPQRDVVDLCRWASLRYAGRLRPLLVAASPPRLVPALPAHGSPRASAPSPALSRSGLEAEIGTATVQALGCSSAVLRLPPAAPRLAVVTAAIEATRGRGDLLVLAPSKNDASILASRLERARHPVALQPEDWAAAASGGRVVVGTRSAVLSRLSGLSAIVVLDAHADSYQEQRVPTWEATVLAEERARRAGVPCVLVSACPSVEMVSGRRLFTLSRDSERSGWAPIEVLDVREEDPRARGYSARLAAVIRDAAREDPGRPVVAVLNRKGRARLLACGRCRGLLRCARCGAALVQLERAAPGETALLHCPRCLLDTPAQCASCGPTRPVIVRPGVARAREDLAALTGLEVAEIARAGAGVAPDAPVLIGTEAVLHRAAPASVVVFLDFDNELLAPRFRAGEQALALLALASRLIGGRRRSGRVVVRTRVPDHEVLDAALHADPGRLAAQEGPRRRQLRLPPETALALVSGDGAAEFASRLSTVAGSLEVGSTAPGRFLIRATAPQLLAQALADAGPPHHGTRIEVAPRQV